MPEYLAPAVYVEEVDTGSKPIEGVSTSTAGMVGVTERGPVNIPVLVTSFGEYRRWFGDMLNPADFAPHCYLPHSVEGFFGNGGKRVFITRVAADEADTARRLLFEQQATPAFETTLLARIVPNDTRALLLGDPAIVLNDWLRVGSGGDAEYVQASAPDVVPPAARSVAALGVPLGFPYAQATKTVRNVVLPAAAVATATTAGAVEIGASILRLEAIAPPAAAIQQGTVLRITAPGAGFVGDEEFVIVASVTGEQAARTVTLATPALLRHPTASNVQVYTAAGFLGAAAAVTTTRPLQAGDTILPELSAAPGAGGTIVFINDGAIPAADVNTAPPREIRRIGDLRRVTLSLGAYVEYPPGSVVQHVNRADAAVAPGRDLAVDVAAGSTVVELNDRRAITVGTVLRFGAIGSADVEYLTVREVPNQSASTAVADPGRVILVHALQRPHTAGALTVTLQTVTVVGIEDNQAALSLPIVPGEAVATFPNVRTAAPIWPPDGPPPALPLTRLLRITLPDARVYLHRMVAAAAEVVHEVPILTQFRVAHGAGAAMTSAARLLRVQALDLGAWGNRLRISLRRQNPPIVRTTVRDRVGNALKLSSSSGVEVGTILQVVDANGEPVGAPFKVERIDRQNSYELTFPAANPPDPAAAIGARVESVEFELTVRLLRQPDPAQPNRNNQVIDSEVFRSLSLDDRHSRYVHKVIGTTWVPGAPGDLDQDGNALRRVDRRSEGESQYIRVRDLAQDLAPAARLAELARIRMSPDLLLDTLADGTTQPSRLALDGGDDQIPGVNDDTCIGADAAEPINRTGLQTLRNVEEISIVACPGETSPALQNALINHCELMRYRFAVLDGSPPPRDTIADVQSQRSQFDTKYAALYHPWVLIPNPYAATPGVVQDYPIPPSGHMIGIYARTDIERGVHKAPANEVVRGVTGLRRTLNKEQHDILNPYPVNINVIRDFRPNNRGIRIYGGRVITSDSDWKYVNVRRLLIFIEASIDRGLQWVVFEPNAEPLWARARRSVKNFLTVVWRNGALEGTAPEEAFFVKCDRTTMTQTDIDNGRLICRSALRR